MSSANKKVQKSSRLTSPFLLIVIAIIVLGLGAGILAAVLLRGGEGTTTSAIKLPSYVNDPIAPRGTAVAYQFAVDHPEVLEKIPCYCGCAGHENHKSNLDCFVESRDGDNIVFDDHAYG